MVRDHARTAQAGMEVARAIGDGDAQMKSGRQPDRIEPLARGSTPLTVGAGLTLLLATVAALAAAFARAFRTA